MSELKTSKTGSSKKMSSHMDHSSSGSFSVQIAQCEKKINDLTECNKMLTKALETSNRIIEQHEKTIYNLQKKLELHKPQLFRQKLHELGKCIRQLSDFRDDALILLSNCETDGIITIGPRNSRSNKVCLPNNMSLEMPETSLHIPDSTQHGASPVITHEQKISTAINGSASNSSVREERVKASDSYESKSVPSKRSSHSKSLSSDVKKKKQLVISHKKEGNKKNDKRILKIKISRPVKRKQCASSSSSSELQSSRDENSMLLSNIISPVKKEIISYQDDDILAIPSTSKAKQFKPNFKNKKRSDSNKKSKKTSKRPKDPWNSSDDPIVISDSPDSLKNQDLSNSHSSVQNHKQRRKISDEPSDYNKMVAEAKTSKLPHVLLCDILKSKDYAKDPLITKYRETENTCVTEPTIQLEDPVDKEIPHLVPETVIVEEAPDDVEIPSVSELETVPVVLEDIIDSVCVNTPPDLPNSPLHIMTNSFEPLDFEPHPPSEHCDPSFFRLLEEVNSITERLQPAA